MFLVRAAAFLQVAFLPGYLLLVKLGIERTGRIQTLLRAFAASLIINWILVFALTLAGIYRPPVVWAVFLLECAWLVRHQWREKGPEDILGLGRLEPLRAGPLPFQAAFVLALASAVTLAGYVLQNTDAVITEWDAVVSWNRWALDWAANRLPAQTQHYPQLVPASWSVLYVFAKDTTVQAPVRMLQAFYPLAIVLTFLDLGLRQRSARILLAAPVWAVCVHLMAAPWNVVPDVLSSGWVDIPVSFFGLLAVVTSLYGDERDRWLALLFAIGAALTKQAGICVLAFVWIDALVKVRSRRFALGSAALVAGLFASWYVMKEVQIQLGLDASEVAYVTGGVHFGRGPLERVAYAGVLLGRIPYLGLLGIPGLLGAGALTILSLRDARQRVVVLGLALPFVVIWTFLYSYDTRNLSLAVPLLALAVCHALPARAVTWRPPRLALVAAVAVALAAFGAVTYSEADERNQQTARRREIWDPALNAVLYRYFDANPMKGKVLTAYQILGFLPGLEDRMVVNPGGLGIEELIRAEADPEIAYVLHPMDWMSPEAKAAVAERIAAGRYRHLFYAQSNMGLGQLWMIQIRP